MDRLLIGIGIAVAIAGVAAVSTMRPSPTPGNVPVSVEPVREASAPAFAWRLVEVEAGASGVPRTRIALDAVYAPGDTLSKEVGVVDGYCNAVDPNEEDADMAPSSTKLQCYYAGLGHWFKVVEGAEAYEARGKTFEEAAPEYELAPQAYETVAEFPIRR